DCLINDREVSRRHARFVLDQDGLFVADLGSRNGTLVNGECITGRRRLVQSDVVQVGPAEIVRFNGTSEGYAPRRDPQPADPRSAPDLVIVDPQMKKVYALVERLA